ncbi:MAG TPA: GDSL-type esterase/lipase family protein [Tepidisphaeraceae bacterium]|jgi:beta-glucosidase|nr:GDSL-type esterase/lipase family protein [Tepidisphaeraceae bacterium]
MNYPAFAVLLAMTIVGPVLAQPTTSPATTRANPNPGWGMMDRQDPARPAMRLNRDGSESQGFVRAHERHLQRASEGPVDLLFIGDSITERWGREGNREIFDEFFGQYKSANFGIGGDHTQHVLWRIEHGALDNIDPKVVVLLIGTNNHARNAQGMTDGVTAVVSAIQKKLPRTRILLIGILPRGSDMTNPTVRARREKIAAVNLELAKLDDDERVEFVDVGDAFIDDAGLLPKQLMPDLLHPSADGYRVMAEQIKPHVDRMMQAQPLPERPAAN